MTRLAVFAFALILIGCKEEQPPQPKVQPPAPTIILKAEPVIAEPQPLPASPAAPGVPREALRYQRDLVGNARAVWGLNAPVATFAGQVHQESTWKANARSRTGAAGLAQFMPRTSDWISGLYSDELGANEPLNPAWALRALVRYDRYLYDRIGKWETDCDRVMFSLASYNGGLGWVNKRMAKSPRPGHYYTTAFINPGIAPSNQKENEEYAHRIVKRWQPLYLAWGLGVCT